MFNEVTAVKRLIFLVIICLLLWLTGIVNPLNHVAKQKKEKHNTQPSPIPVYLQFKRPETFSRNGIKDMTKQTRSLQRTINIEA